MESRSTGLRVKQTDLKPSWQVLDADGKTLGRFSSEISRLLQGKHNPSYVRHLHSGDFVVVVNAGRIRVTGKKLDQKIYYRHSGYHGGLKQRTLGDVMQSSPEDALRHAVKGMLPKNKLGRQMLSRLKIYRGADHKHQAQIPTPKAEISGDEE